MSRRILNVTAVNNGADYLLTGWKADEVIEATGRGAVWSRLYGGWLLYARDVPDVVAAAQYRNVLIVGELPPVAPASIPIGAVVPELVQFDLFGGAA